MKELIESMQATPEQWAAGNAVATKAVLRDAIAPKPRPAEEAPQPDWRHYESLGSGSYRLLMSTNADGESYEN